MTPFPDAQEPAPPAGEAAQPADGGGFLWELVTRPGVLEAVLVVTVTAIVVFVWWRLSALMQNAQARRALSDYLLGVEQALQGDLRGAEKRLVRVLEQDPENHYARLLLGKVLGELGEAERAHQQHLYLKKAFAVESADNDLMLAESLLGAGLPGEAADVAEQALQHAPQRAAGWEFVYRARLRASDHEGALRAGRRLLGLLRDADERRRLEADLARTIATVGTMRWRHGDARAAQKLSKEARALLRDDGGSPAPALLEARLAAGEQGLAETAKLLTAPAADGDGAAGSRALAVAGAAAGPDGAPRLPMATFAGLVEPARWACSACDAPLARPAARCPRCGAAASADLREPRLVADLPSPTEAMDRIDVNDAHVQRLVQAFLGGEPAERAAAREQIVALGERGVPELLRAAWRRADDSRARRDLIDVLRAMGPGIAPALFRASDVLAQQRLIAVGSGPADVVGRILQGFGREALPHVDPLFASARPEHRRILIDYYLGLGDVDAFQAVLERFPPMEILHRLNNGEADALVGFLADIPRGHFLAESLLLEPTFYRDEALLAAVPAAEDPEVLVRVMLQRGPTRTLVSALIVGVGDDRVAATAQRVLQELGDRVLEHCLQAYAAPDGSDDSKKRLARVLALGGGAAAAHIADAFGPQQTAFDDELRRLLVIIGDDAVDAMASAYERSGWVEKVTGGLLRRHNNRRVQLANALGELGTRDATRALKALLKREKDDNLRLVLTRALHTAEGRTDG